MREGIGIVLTEGGHLRQARAGGEHGAVVVRLELDRIAQRHFSPRSLRILLTKPLPNSLRLPCIGSWLLRSPRRTVKWPLPPLWVSKVMWSSIGPRMCFDRGAIAIGAPALCRPTGVSREMLASTPEGPQKFAIILAQEQLPAMDGYERRALSRRKF